MAFATESNSGFPTYKGVTKVKVEKIECKTGLDQNNIKEASFNFTLRNEENKVFFLSFSIKDMVEKSKEGKIKFIDKFDNYQYAFGEGDLRDITTFNDKETGEEKSFKSFDSKTAKE